MSLRDIPAMYISGSFFANILKACMFSISFNTSLFHQRLSLALIFPTNKPVLKSTGKESKEAVIKVLGLHGDTAKIWV
jgi:hypothetical protein